LLCSHGARVRHAPVFPAHWPEPTARGWSVIFPHAQKERSTRAGEAWKVPRVITKQHIVVICCLTKEVCSKKPIVGSFDFVQTSLSVLTKLRWAQHH
jgi:hypothetical protein